MFPHVDAAVSYAEGVKAGTIPAGNWVKLAATRFLNDLERAADPASAWEFRPDLASRPVVFCELMPNIKGPMAGKPLRLDAWQKFCVVNVFGFVERGTTTRRFRQAIIYVPRGNGKTSLMAPIALYCSFCENEGGAEGYAAAVTRDQAKILFETAQNMVRKSPEFRKRYGVEVSAHAIYQTSSASRFNPVSSDAKALDGLNVAVSVLDEIGSHKTPEVYDVMLTAMGKRRQPLLVAISTATSNNFGIGKQLWDYVAKVLSGAVVDDRIFGVLYAADDDDDVWDESTWVKANPGWGTTVQPPAIQAIAKQARQNPAQEAAFKTRHLNIWVNADAQLFQATTWVNSCARPGMTPATFTGWDLYGGLDLASKVDLAASVRLFRSIRIDSKPIYKVFARFYLPEAAILDGRNPYYTQWASEGWLTVTPGDVTDFDQIEADLISDHESSPFSSIGFDPWAATQLANNMQAAGLPMIEYRQSVVTMSEPTKELDALIRDHRIEHDGNPVLAWCMSNVVGHYDRKGNVYPTKQRVEYKIDGAVALIMALGRSIVDNGGAGASYADQGGIMFG
jgi:phage terminase large subunit-like protein